MGTSPPDTLPYGSENESVDLNENSKTIKDKFKKQLFVVMQKDANDNVANNNEVDIGNPNRYNDIMSSDDESVASQHFKRRSRQNRPVHNISPQISKDADADMSDYEQDILFKEQNSEKRGKL